MHTLPRTAAVATIFFVAHAAIAADPQAPSAADAKSAPAAAAAQHDGNHVANDAANQARYRRHNGRWWYRTNKDTWVVWQNNAWAPYTPGMFANETASRQPTRRYSYDPGQGNGNFYPRLNRAPRAFGDSRSIRYAGSKANADYAPYTGGSVQ